MKNLSNYDFIIIPGAGLIESIRRAEYTGELVKNYKIPIIVTGGKPRKIVLIQNPNGKTESKIMKEILEKKGICSERIYEEPHAQNTKENFENSKTLIKKLISENPKILKIAIIDNKAHIPRSLKIAKDLLYPNYVEGFSIPLDYQNPIKNILIESISFLLELTPKKGNYKFYNNPKLL